MSARVYKQESSIDWRRIAALSVYGAMYSLYVWKYSYANRPFPELTLLVYGLIAPTVIALAMSPLPGRFAGILSGRSYVLATFALAVGFWILMSHFDPASIQVGRYPALVEWNDRLFSGQFPYQAGCKPSGFPALFIVAAPLYWLGEVGLLQIVGLSLFAWVAYSWCGPGSIDRFRIMAFFFAAPIVAYEVCVRSELVANGVIILAALEVTRRYHNYKSVVTPVWLGLLLGLVASTRGIFLPAYLITLPLVLRNHTLRYAILLLGTTALGFVLTLTPFMIWNWDYFWNFGPFSVQLSHIPAALLVSACLVSLVGGLLIREYRSAYLLTGAVLFGIVGIKMATSLVSHGVADTVQFDNYFDMAYFGFALPFLATAAYAPAKPPG
jgi:hypothetical protein